MKLQTLRREILLINQLSSLARLLVVSLIMMLMFSILIHEIVISAPTLPTAASRLHGACSTSFRSSSAAQVDWITKPAAEHAPLAALPELLKEDILDDFLNTEVERLFDQSDIGTSCQLEATGFSSVMGEIAVSVRSLAIFSDLALSELAEAINVVELAAEKAKNSEFVPRFEFISDGLLSVLNDSSSDILTHAARSLSAFGFEEMRKFSQSNSKQRDQKLREFLSRSRALAKAKRAKTGHSLLKFLSLLVQKGISLTENLYLSPLFLEKLPLVGKILVDLKREGRTTYQLINSIRSLRSVMDMYREIKSRRGSKAKLIVIEKPKKMFTDIGMDALRWLAHRLANSHKGVEFGSNGIDELVRRSAHYLLLQVVTRIPSCALAHF